MSDTNDTPTCPDCGTALPADSPGGACPVCLMGAGLESAEPDAAPPRVPTSPEELGELFPELEILEEVGRGGMGIVWKARQKALDRVVALKILTVGGDDAPAFAERFGREARALARLDHPNIVRVIEFGERDGVYFLTMDFVDGATLREAIDDGGLQPEQALAIVPQICDALQYAHDQGVVHRDIKPENVLLDKDSRVRIADFGLAKLSAGGVPEVTLTRAGQVMGTLHYMAPEQIESPLLVDHRADIYSLGVVFYEMLTGELPIGRFDPPSDRVQLDVRLDDVVLRALSKRRERRYQTAAEVKNEVTTISTTDGATAAAAAMAARVAPPREHRAEPEAPQDRRWSRKAIVGFFLPWVGGPAAVAVVALFAGAGGGHDPNIGLGLFAMAAIGGSVLVGMVLSIWAWVEIARSNGRLRGLWFAILGSVLPLCSPIGLVAMAGPWYMVRTEEPVINQPVLDTERTVYEVFEEFRKDGGRWTLEERIARMDPEDREALPARLPTSVDAMGALTNGLLFVPPSAIPGDPADYHIESTEFLMDPREVDVRVTDGTHVIQFRLVVRDGRNYFDRVPVLIGPREDFEAR